MKALEQTPEVKRSVRESVSHKPTGALITKVQQAEMRLEGMTIDCDNLCLTRQPPAKQITSLTSKLQSTLGTLNEISTKIDQEGLHACGSATQTYQC